MITDLAKVIFITTCNKIKKNKSLKELSKVKQSKDIHEVKNRELDKLKSLGISSALLKI